MSGSGLYKLSWLFQWKKSPRNEYHKNFLFHFHCYMVLTTQICVYTFCKYAQYSGIKCLRHNIVVGFWKNFFLYNFFQPETFMHASLSKKKKKSLTYLNSSTKKINKLHVSLLYKHIVIWPTMTYYLFIIGKYSNLAIFIVKTIHILHWLIVDLVSKGFIAIPLQKNL